MDVRAIPSVSMDSDHRLVVMKTKILAHKAQAARKTKQINAKNLDDESKMQFIESLNRQDTLEQETSENIEDTWAKLKHTIYKAVEVSMGYKYNRANKRKRTPWWNDSVKQAVSEKGVAFRKWTAENRKNYKTKRNQAHAAKRDAKQEKWKQIFDDLEEDLQGNKKLLFQMAKNYRKEKTEKVYNIRDSDTGDILTNPYKIDETWRKYFSTLLNG